MMPGLFDLPAPLFGWIDDRLAPFMPAAVIVALWAVLGAIVCLEIYRVVSPQKKIGRIRVEAREAQQALSSYDGEFDGALPLIKRMLTLSFKRVGIVIPATLVAAYPVLVLLAWLSNTYGHRYPGPEEAVAVTVSPPAESRWLAGNTTGPPRVQTLAQDGRVAFEFPLLAPVPVLHKRQWWNWLLSNPAGYLPDDTPVQEIRLQFPARELVAAGPAWLRGWEVVFIPVLFVVALAYKSARKID